MEKKLTKAKISNGKKSTMQKIQITPRNKNRCMNEGPRKSML
jgi:hypothetical protein